MQASQSAGGVVVSPQKKILLTNQNGDSWSLPKGIIEPGEDVRIAAKREIAEETGVTDLAYVEDLGTYERMRIAKGGKGDIANHKKVITLFLYTTSQTTLAPTDPTHPEARWVDPDKVTDMLTHPKDKAFFQSIRSRVDAII